LTKIKKETKLLVLKIITNNNNMTKLLLLSISILLMSGCSWGVFNKNIEIEERREENINQEVEKEEEQDSQAEHGEMIFVAKEKDKKITAVLFDPVKNKVIYEREFDYKDELSRISMTRDVIQFDYKTKDMFIYTGGESPYDGTCINEDGTCAYRIYKTSLVYDTAKLKKVYETDESLRDWLINSEEGYLVLFFYDNNKKETEIKKINFDTGEEMESIVVGESDWIFTSLHDPFASDSRYVYYFSDSSDKNGKNNILKLTMVDLDTLEREEIEVYRGDDSLHSKGSLSPDKKKIGLHLLNEDGIVVFAYDIEKKELKRIPHTTPVVNMTLKWSGDSSRLVYILTESLEFYDFNKDEKVFIAKEESAYIFEWFPSDRYLLFTNYMKGNQAWADLVILDVLEDKQIKIKTENREPAQVSDIVGISIY